MFAQRLKQLRKGMGLTQIQLAQEFRVSNGAVGMWETGKREPDFATIHRLARSLPAGRRQRADVLPRRWAGKTKRPPRG